MRIRKGRKEDVKASIKLDREVFPADDPKSIKARFENKPFLVAIENNKIVGFIAYTIRRFNNSLYVEDIGVKKGYRDKGVGSGLLSAVKKTAKNKKHSRVFLDTWSSNKAAIRFYRDNGFVECGRIKDYVRKGIDTVFFYCRVK